MEKIKDTKEQTVDKRRQQIEEEVLENQRQRNKEDLKNKINPLYSLKEERCYLGIYEDIIELIEAIASTCSKEAISKTAGLLEKVHKKEIEKWQKAYDHQSHNATHMEKIARDRRLRLDKLQQKIKDQAKAIFDDLDNVDIVEWDTLEKSIKTKVDGQHNVDYILTILKEAVRDRINDELKKKYCSDGSEKEGSLNSKGVNNSPEKMSKE